MHYKEQVELEKEALDKKIDTLENFLKGDIEEHVQPQLLRLQLSTMKMYSRLLGLRLSSWED